MSDNMIERMARAMRDRQGVAMDMVAHFGPWESASETNRQEWRALARAALTAMREPTEAMQRAGFERVVTFKRGARDYQEGQAIIESDISPDKGVATIFRAMIDAELVEGADR